MKIHLASFLQPQNFGPGRLIGIVEGAKPRDVKVDLQFQHFTPNTDLLQKYNETKASDSEAGKKFVLGYQAQMDGFLVQAEAAAKATDKSILEVLPFKDGDTLLSWERAEFTNYRKLLAPYLEKMGYEVVLN